ncbi:zf-HC2 domain-containing protein [Streptomyces clavuligerus]|uniref:anti-sigma factor family protein n=1 Tax=Streptomyces clavuligerus TaxID=1901 RepID=UPI0008104A23|nr:zf-HC2 domain-containing protein [Streptomyces clavuligerus]ANW17057.1 hypothetical protein BB341_01830 [Streptomyces clavuligerus]AXU11592.1 zf-HC2 domain-containing protein [Streptomyces clavuligerus]MBY6301414.1 zf-HC2 domain-containing protein [Streptomyces clavuligerus]QPL61709.1 zf-HC2 domain-containing protein [Streptomyces clavuligerus]QPL67741.1 zf-HC2 domain-containing protein [Streptomyces clavuligerus]
MSTQQRHRDVAAYALGLLEPAEARLFERHLAGCVLCAVQLIDFGGAARALSELAAPHPRPRAGAGAGADTAAGPPAALLDRLVGEVALTRRRGRRRWALLASTAAALALAVPTGVLAARPGGPAARPATWAAARDTAPGVLASAQTREQPWGTEVELRISGVRTAGPCRLVAVDRAGRAHPVLSWAARDGGAARIAGGTALPSGHIAHWQVRTAGGTPLATLTTPPGPSGPPGR